MANKKDDLSPARSILAEAERIANSPEAIRHSVVILLIGTSRGQGLEIEEKIFEAAGYRDGEYWHNTMLEPMTARSFAHLLAVHQLDPTERLSEFDRRSLVQQRIESSLRLALRVGESWFIKDPGGTDDLNRLMLYPRAAAKWLLDLPKRTDLVPPGLRASLEPTDAPAPEPVASLDKGTKTPKVKKDPGRPPGTGFQKGDALLYPKMQKLIDNGEVSSAREAAKKVADRADGKTLEAKLKRLSKGFRNFKEE